MHPGVRSAGAGIKMPGFKSCLCHSRRESGGPSLRRHISVTERKAVMVEQTAGKLGVGGRRQGAPH